MNKRGNVLDFFYIMMILLVISVAIMAAMKLVNVTNESGLFDDNVDAQQGFQFTENTILNFDNLMMFIIIGLSIFVIVSSALVNNHPAFLIIGGILLFIAVMVSAILSNAHWTFLNSKEIIELASSFPKLVFLMDNLPIYILFMGMAASLAGYIGYRNQ